MTDMEEVSIDQATATSLYHSSDRSKRWLSYSQIASFLHCEYDWAMRYVLRAQLPIPPAAMSLGDGIHRGIAAFLTGDSVAETLSKWRMELLEVVPEELLRDPDGNDVSMANLETAIQIVNRVIESMRDLGWQVLVIDGKRTVEMEMSIPLPGYEEWFDGMAFHIDAIIRDSREKVNFVIDWKTRKTMQPASSEEVNLQNAMYQYAAIQNGIPTAGTITYQTMSKALASPKLNKDGTMSKAKISTDWQTYKAALETAGLNPSDYTDMMYKLDTEFVRPIKAYRGRDELHNIWDQIVIPVLNRISWLKSSPSIIPLRSLSYMSCMNCGSRAVCQAALRNYDVGGVLNLQYHYDKEEFARLSGQGWF